MKQADKKRQILGAAYPTSASFWVSVSLYFGIIFGLFMGLYNTDLSQKFTNDPDAFMDVLVVEAEQISEAITTHEPPQMPVLEPINEPPKPAPKETPPAENPPQPAPKINELFGDSAPLPDFTPPPTTKVNRPKNEAAAADILKNLQSSVKSSAPKSQQTGVYNKLLGDINEIIQKKWVQYSAQTSAQAVAIIFIDTSGRISTASVKTPSLDSEFNAKVRDFLEQLRQIQFPTPPQLLKLTLNLKDELEIQAAQ